MVEKSFKIIFGTLAGILFVFSIFTLQPAGALTSPTGVIIPLYNDPDATWDKVVAAKTTNPTVPVIVIINPQNGPGTSQNADYTSGIQKLKSAGIIVLGYVHTNYGARSTSSVEADIDSYKSWYPIDGIMFDEMAADTAGFETYYSDLSNYAKSKGFTFTQGNPGTDPLPSYIGIVDNITIFESEGLPSLSFLGGWHTNYDKKNFAAVSYGINTLDPTFVNAESQFVGYTYLTDNNLPDPYNTPSSYLDTLVSILDATCTVPTSGDWMITSNCVLASSTTAPANLIISNGAVLTIPNGVTLNFHFDTNHIIVQQAGGILLKSGGKILSPAQVTIESGAFSHNPCSPTNCFNPSNLAIKTGTLVKWTNNDFTFHTVTSGLDGDLDSGSLFDSMNISPGGTFTHIFSSVGSFNYHCKIHTWLIGHVDVS